MTTLLLDEPMAKRKDAPVKIDLDVLEECRVAAAFRGMTLVDYLSQSMRLVAKKDIDEAIAHRQKAEAPRPPKR